MASGGAGKGGGAAVKGLRLLTLTRHHEGFGFHMYTNRERDGQYVKSVAPNSPADLSGMLPGDHVLSVDGHSVVGETHHQVSQPVSHSICQLVLSIASIEYTASLKNVLIMEKHLCEQTLCPQKC